MKLDKSIVLIFSPQNWSHQFISKHHYAIAFSKKTKTYFIEPTTCSIGKFKVAISQPLSENQKLFVVKFTLPFPEVIRFKIPFFFKRINRWTISRWVKKNREKPELLIDFGCHKSILDWSFINCQKKIYFPVDDFQDLPIQERGCNAFFTVSKNIQEKFKCAGINMKFINHGLNHWFANRAINRLKEIENGYFEKRNDSINIAYSGNLTIPFLDRIFILTLVSKYPNYEFHFFGKYESSDLKYLEWLNELKSHHNVHLYGQLSVKELSDYLFKMDVMLLCYKPDHKNYHAENSHKINEYLSTGAPLLSTYITILEESTLVYFIEQGDDVLNDKSIKSIVQDLNDSNLKKMEERIKYALQYRYEGLVEKISS